MKLFTIFFAILFSLTSSAQETEYSYLTDKHFYDPSDLIGYLFRPAVLETTDGDSQELEADEYSFGISGNYLYVKGGELTAAYNIGTIDPTKYGFKLTLMNARDVLKAGHLKVILTGPGYVDALVFRASKDDEELIFMLPEKSDEVYESDKNYYTDKWNTIVESPDSIWGISIKPYFAVVDGNKHNRIVQGDSLSISFVEEITIIEKKKKIRKKKKKTFNIETGEDEVEDEEEKDNEDVNENENSDDDQNPEMDEEKVENEKEDEPEYKIKTKIIKEYFIVLKKQVQNDMGEKQIIEKRLKIKKWKEREDKAAKKGGDRYQITFTTNKGDLFLYLTDKRKVSSFEMKETTYLMDGY